MHIVYSFETYTDYMYHVTVATLNAHMISSKKAAALDCIYKSFEKSIAHNAAAYYFGYHAISSP